jgi:hypothetical protein
MPPILSLNRHTAEVHKELQTYAKAKDGCQMRQVFVRRARQVVCSQARQCLRATSCKLGHRQN